MTDQKELVKPVDWDQMYPGRFLKAGELLGKQVTLTIADVRVDELETENGKKVKGVLFFRETSKQLALNTTNGICIKAMFGRKLAEWEGKRITIFPGLHKGEPAIRIWGSPDISADMNVVVQLPRKKPTPMTMHKVQPRNGGEPKP